MEGCLLIWDLMLYLWQELISKIRVKDFKRRKWSIYGGQDSNILEKLARYSCTLCLIVIVLHHMPPLIILISATILVEMMHSLMIQILVHTMQISWQRSLSCMCPILVHNTELIIYLFQSDVISNSQTPTETSIMLTNLLALSIKSTLIWLFPIQLLVNI